MAWFWTDDIAYALIEHDVVTRDQVSEWLHRPVAIAAEQDVDPVEIGRRILGLSDASLEEAGAA